MGSPLNSDSSSIFYRKVSRQNLSQNLRTSVNINIRLEAVFTKVNGFWTSSLATILEEHQAVTMTPT